MSNTRARLATLTCLLWLTGTSLRMTILAIPPLLPRIHHDLHLTETLVGVLTSLPVVLIAAAAVPGSAIIARLGARRSLLLGLGLVAVAGGARGFGQQTPVVFSLTFLMGAGIAISQPALPAIVRVWFPARLGQATAVYANGFLIGELAAVALTAPLILPLVGNSWPFALLFWSVPVTLTVMGIALFTPHIARDPRSIRPGWWPNWHSRLTWSMGLTLGCASIAYFGSNAFIPDYLRATHRAALITPALTALNLGQLPASLVVALVPERIVGRRWPILLAGLLTASMVLLYNLPGNWIIVWAALVGLASALTFVIMLALAPIVARDDEVHRLSAAMFAIAYSCPLLAALLGGAIWDATGIPFAAFFPVLAAGGCEIILSSSVRLPHEVLWTA